MTDKALKQIVQDYLVRYEDLQKDLIWIQEQHPNNSLTITEFECAKMIGTARINCLKEILSEYKQ